MEMQRRSLEKEARRLAERIERLTASLGRREARIAELEVMFGSPDLYDEPDKVGSLSREYQELKSEVAELWREWERLSMKSEEVGKSAEINIRRAKWVA